MLGCIGYCIAASNVAIAADNPASEGNNGQSSDELKQKSELQEVVVTAKYQFLEADTSETTNLPIPIEKVPQSISLVSNDFIKAADLNTLGEIAEYTPGALDYGNQLNLGSLIVLRGFPPLVETDGLPTSFGHYEPDNAIYDRLEVVKGPSSVVYGVSSPGGAVNYVTKSATSETPSYLDLRVGMWNNFRLEGQVAGALDPGGDVRAIGVAVRDQGDSFLNILNHATTTLYGGINAKLTDSITAFVHAGYQHQVRTSFDSIPVEPDGSPAPLPRSYCVCATGLDLTSTAYEVDGDLTWHATDTLDVSLKANYATANTTGPVGYTQGLTNSPTIGDASVGFENFRRLEQDNYAGGLVLLYRFDSLGLKNSFLTLSMLDEALHGAIDTDYSSGSVPTNIFDGQDAMEQAIYSASRQPLSPFPVSTQSKTASYSAQSVIQVLDHLSLLAGLSYAKPTVEQAVLGGPFQDYSTGGQTSYRTALMYEVLPGTNAYVSFSQSFLPQPALIVNNAVAPPLKGDQYEVGTKYRSASGGLLLTGALFELREKNRLQFATNQNGVDYAVPVGEVRHRGLELQALGYITRSWQVNAGYSYLDPKITQNIPQALVGQTELYLPKHTASAYVTHTTLAGPLRGLTVGGGIRYVGPQRTSYDNALANVQAGLPPTKDLPGYTVVDATASYEFNKWLLQLNAHNIFNRYYFINDYQTLFYGNFPGEPANVTLSIRREF